MGWGYGIVNGREVGYSVRATCDHKGCKKRIDRGLSYACGNEHGGGEHGCGGYFCSKHMSAGYQLCAECEAKMPDDDEDEEDD